MKSVIKHDLVAKCKVCGYSWTTRKQTPKACPDCKSRKWNQVTQ